MHILTWNGRQVAAADRWQRLCMAMSAYDAEDQEHMNITSTGDVLR